MSAFTGTSPVSIHTETEQSTAVDTRLEDIVQVVLYNDDHNTMEHVVECLMKVFGHSMEMAAKIMAEAHLRGRAIAEVEAKSAAILHKEQLISYGLTAEIEKI